MEVQIASLCDYAADYNGKLCVQGAFDTILVQQLPAVHMHCSVALRIVFRDTDTGEHTMKLAMIDEDGRDQLPENMPQPKLNIALADNMYFATNNFVFNLQGLKFPTAGQYSIDISIDDKMIARIPLQVIQVQNPQQPPGQGA